MSGLLAGALRETCAGFAQVPADELTDESSAVVADGFRSWFEALPEVLLEPDASDFVRRCVVVRHGPRVYGMYVRCPFIDGSKLTCNVCPLYVRSKGMNSTKPRHKPASKTGFRDDPTWTEGAAMLTLAPEGAETLIDPVDLESLEKDLVGTGALIFIVGHHDLDECSECPEDDGPLPSVLVIEYRRFNHTYREPVCGQGCALAKVRALRNSKLVPSYIHLFVISETQDGCAR